MKLTQFIFPLFIIYRLSGGKTALRVVPGIRQQKYRVDDQSWSCWYSSFASDVMRSHDNKQFSNFYHSSLIFYYVCYDLKRHLSCEFGQFSLFGCQDILMLKTCHAMLSHLCFTLSKYVNFFKIHINWIKMYKDFLIQ